MGSEDQVSATGTTDDEVTVALGGASTSPSPEPVTLAPGTTLGRYVVVEEAGSGGVGVVVRAFDPKLHREVALKLLRARTEGGEGPDDDAMLLREAQAMAKLSHPNVLAVYDADSTAMGVFIAMEYVEGQTLRETLAGKAHRWREALELLLPAAEGLAAAHRAGVVHRDFKPSNVLVGLDGRVRVMDFGIARWGREAVGAGRSSGSTLDTHSTMGSLDGAIVGTPAYMAPEQHHDPEADERCDQYAFCLTLAEALCGDRPYRGLRGSELVEAKRAGDWSFPSSSSVPQWLRRIVLRGMAPERERRWPSMQALLDAVAGARRRRRLARLAAGTTVIGLALGGLSFVALEQEVVSSCDAEPELAGVWDDERREQVARALRASELPFAESTWDRLERGLDDYAETWIASREEACLATRGRATQSELLDLRVACLERRRRALAATVDVLAEADREVVLKAIDTVAALPPLSPCDEADYLLAAVAPPDDAAVAEQVDGVRDELARADALFTAGRVDEAAAIVSGALERARALEYRPLLAQVLRGTTRDPELGLEESERRLEDAYFAALSVGDDEEAFRAASSLVYTVGYKGGRIEDGLAWERHARAVGESLPEPIVARLDTSVGALLARRGDFKGALEHFQRSLDRPREGSTSTLELARVTSNVGGVKLMLGDQEAGQRALLDALGYFEEALGPEHPDLAGVLNNLGVVALERGEPDAALEYLRRAQRLEEDAYGEQHPSVAFSLDNIGNVLMDLGDHEGALREHERALALRRASLPAGHPDIAISLTSRASALVGLERLDEARRDYEEALSMLDEKSNLREYHSARFQLGRLLWERHPEGPEHEQGLELMRSVAAAAESDENLVMVRAMVDGWLEAHEGTSLELSADDGTAEPSEDEPSHVGP